MILVCVPDKDEALTKEVDRTIGTRTSAGRPETVFDVLQSRSAEERVAMIAQEFEQGRPAMILLVEDNPSDVELTVETLRFGSLNNQLRVVEDGVEAMRFLRRLDRFANVPRPDLILLDLNLPRKNGRELLSEMKADADLKRIPVVILTASPMDCDAMRMYELNNGCCLTKPLELAQFLEAVRSFRDFRLTLMIQS